MNTRLRRAVEKAESLPEPEQDAIAALILDEIEAEARWTRAFAENPAALRKLADEGRAEHEAGLTRPLDPGKI